MFKRVLAGDFGIIASNQDREYVYVWDGKNWNRDPKTIKWYATYPVMKKAYKAAGYPAGSVSVAAGTLEECERLWDGKEPIGSPVIKNASESPKYSSNPPQTPDVFEKSDQAKKDGYNASAYVNISRRRWIEANLHRAQADVYLRNMIKALTIHSWNNTAEEWQRMYDAQYTLALRKKNASKASRRVNPGKKKIYQVVSHGTVIYETDDELLADRYAWLTKQEKNSKVSVRSVNLKKRKLPLLRS